MATYTITYNSTLNLFLIHSDGILIGQDSNGRELGRMAWLKYDTEKVVYSYDLALDENIPLRKRHV